MAKICCVALNHWRERKCVCLCVSVCMCVRVCVCVCVCVCVISLLIRPFLFILANQGSHSLLNATAIKVGLRCPAWDHTHPLLSFVPWPFCWGIYSSVLDVWMSDRD